MKSYFPKLDSIRFYAFVMVFVSHSYFNSRADLIPTFPILVEKGDRWFAHGEVGVQAFFMLSGFLILYLSLRRLRESGTFSIANFFKRRILRIWPLYFLVIGISYALYLIQGKAVALGCTPMFLYFLGNVCIYIGLPDVVSTVTISPLWSISVEEQFYVLFPLLFMLAIWSYKKYKTMTGVLAGLLLLALLAYSLYTRYLFAHDWSYVAYSTVSALSPLAIGMLLAIVVATWEKFFIQIARYRKTLTVIGLVSFALFYKVKFYGDIGVSLYVLPICLATGIAIVLSMFAVPQKDIATPSRAARATQYLGRISYGLYVYHMLAILLANYAYSRLGAASEYLPNIFSKIALTLGLTVLMAHLSYQYIEKWFLRFK